MKIKKILSVAALAGVGAVALASSGKNTKEIQWNKSMSCS